MEKKTEKIANGLFAAFCGSIVILAGVFCYKTAKGCRQQLSDSAKQIDELERSIADTKLANSELERRLDECQQQLGQQRSIAAELTTSSQQSVSTVSDIIDLIKDIRKKIAILEDSLDGGNSDLNSDDINSDISSN